MFSTVAARPMYSPPASPSLAFPTIHDESILTVSDPVETYIPPPVCAWFDKMCEPSMVTTDPVYTATPPPLPAVLESMKLLSITT